MFTTDQLNCLIDLHLHLDGALTPENCRKLAALQGIAIPESEEALRRLIQVEPGCQSLNEFLEKFAFPCSLIRSYEGLKAATFNLCRELIAQGVMYAEIRFAPQLCTGQGMSQREAICAARDGLKKSGLKGGLILCCMRGKDNGAANLETVDLCAEFLGDGVCALDLAGAEAIFPNRDYADLFAYARQKGLPYTIHAGEAAGPDSVEVALEYAPKRIGHGVRAIEDEATLAKLVEKQVPLELCPISNLDTAIYEELSEYPLRNLWDKGIYMTINTDDPAIEGINQRMQLNALIEQFSLTKDEVKQLLLNAANAAFAPEALKAELRAQIEREFAGETFFSA